MASEVGAAFVSLIPSARGFSKAVRAQLRNALKQFDNRVDLATQVDKGQAAKAGQEASRVANEAAGPIQLRVDLDRRNLRRAVPALGAIPKVLAVSTVGLATVGAAVQGLSAALAGLAAAGAAAIPVLAELGRTLVAASGAAIAIPGAVAIAGAAIATLVVGFRGLGDALGEVGADAAAFEEAIADLAPAAQQFARAVRELREPFSELQLDVQQQLFQGLAGVFDRMARSQLPVLHDGLVGIAGVLNGAMRDGLRELASGTARLRLEEIFEAAQGALGGLRQAVRPLLGALLDVAAVGAQVVEDLAGPAGEALAAFGDRVSEMAASGELRDLILGGLDALRTLGAALVDIAGIISGVFGAAGDDGGLFAFLDRLNETVNSITGQETLGRLFTELARIGDALQPVFLALLDGLGVVAGAIGDIAEQTAPFLEQFLGSFAQALASLAPGFIALGPAVAALGQALVPVGQILSDLVVALAPHVETFIAALAEGLEALAPAAEPVGRALGAILDAVAPLLPLLGAALANALTVLATIITGLVNGPGIALIEVFAGIFEQLHRALTPVLTELAERLMPVFIEAGNRIVQAFEPMIPVIAEIAEHLGAKLANVLPDLVEAFSELVLAFADMAGPIGQAFLDLIIGLVPQLPKLVDAGLGLALALADLLKQLVPIIPELTKMLGLVLKFVTPQVLAALTGLILAAASALQSMTGSARKLIGPLRTVIDWVKRMRDTVSDRLRSVRNLFRDLPGRIRRAVGNLGRLLVQAGRQVVQGLIDGITSRFQGVRDTLGRLTDLLPDWKGPQDRDRRILRPAGRAVIDGFRAGLTDEIPRVESTLRSFTASMAGGGDLRSAALDGVIGGASAGPDVLVLDIDLGEGIKQRIEVSLREHDRQVARRVRAGTGAVR